MDVYYEQLGNDFSNGLCLAFKSCDRVNTEYAFNLYGHMSF